MNALTKTDRRDVQYSSNTYLKRNKYVQYSSNTYLKRNKYVYFLQENSLLTEGISVHFLAPPCTKCINECIIEISTHLSRSPLEAKTILLRNYPFTYHITLDRSAAPLPLLLI
jgi:hypothetical protein